MAWIMLRIWSWPNWESGSKYSVLFVEQGKASFLNLLVWVEFGNLKEFFFWAGPTCQWPVSILTALDGHPVPHTALFLVAMLTAWRASRCWRPPIVAAPRGLAPLSLCSDVTTGDNRLFHFPLPPFDHGSSLLCSTPAAASPTNANQRWAAFELSNWTKRSAPSPCPSCTENMPAAPASKVGQWEFPRKSCSVSTPPVVAPLVVPWPRSEFRATKELLPDHFSGCLDHSFGPHWRVLPIDTCIAIEMNPPVSTPFPASASRFSCSCV
jgi:hypothetical protein